MSGTGARVKRARMDKTRPILWEIISRISSTFYTDYYEVWFDWDDTKVGIIQNLFTDALDRM